MISCSQTMNVLHFSQSNHEPFNIMKFLMTLYSILYRFLLPLVILRILWKSRSQPEYRQRLSERFGYYNQPPCKQPTIWVHAVSVGETLTVIPLINHLLTRYPEYPVVITTTTPTGSMIVRKRLGNKVRHVYLPYDLPRIITKFIKQHKPLLAIIMETEIWPNLIDTCYKRNIKTLIINARLSQRSLRQYQKFTFFFKPLLQKIHQILAQSSSDLAHYHQLGVDISKIVLTGNLKYDVEYNVDQSNTHIQYQQNIIRNRPAILAASTHPHEESIVLSAYKNILDDSNIPNPLLVLVPRHPDRCIEVIELCHTMNLNYQLHSSRNITQANTHVYIVDGIGELLLFYKCCDCAFVGGSLVNIGGHNILEPAALDCPIICGPHMYNFQEIFKQFINNQALIKVENPQQLSHAFKTLLLDSKIKSQLTTNAKNIFNKNTGALHKTLNTIDNILQLSNYHDNTSHKRKNTHKADTIN